jgi:hypothetical protein
MGQGIAGVEIKGREEMKAGLLGFFVEEDAC